jgi:hypothetical protein
MDMSVYKLGKLPPQEDRRTLKLEKYTANLPPPPPRVNPIFPPNGWNVMLNDQIGCCTISCMGHLFMDWSQVESGTPVVIPDSAVLSAYEAVTGEEGAAYDPATGANDNGCVILDVLNYTRQTGIGGQTISAFAQIGLHNKTLLKQAIALFGGVDIGLLLPLTAQSQVGTVWNVTDPTLSGDAAPGSWGGHSVPVCFFNEGGVWVITWGQLQRVSWSFLWAYCDEAWAIISPLWLAKNGADPHGLDLAQLQADLSAATVEKEDTNRPRPH